jgi:hypothetical protein
MLYHDGTGSYRRQMAQHKNEAHAQLAQKAPIEQQTQPHPALQQLERLVIAVIGYDQASNAVTYNRLP